MTDSPFEGGRTHSAVGVATRAEPVSVEPLSAGEEPAWDRYVRQSTAGSFFHLLGWRRVVERSFRQRPVYLLARRDGRVTGVLPMFHLKSLLFGRSLVSLPYAIRGGVLADDDEVATALLDRAQSMAEELRVDYLELRSETPASSRLSSTDTYVTFRADLTLGWEELRRRMRRQRRSTIRWAEGQGFDYHIAGPEKLRDFHALFCHTMRFHGTPVYPLRFLQEIFNQYPDQTNLLFVTRGKEVLSATLNILFGDTVLPLYAGTTSSNRVRGTEDFLVWRLMHWAAENGFSRFDFGRSRRGTGSYTFKRYWGMEEIPLNYQYHLVRARKLPNVSPANPRYRMFIRAWRCLPLALTRFLGPLVIRNIP